MPDRSDGLRKLLRLWKTRRAGSKPKELVSAQLAAILESVDEAIICEAKNGKIIGWNRAAELMFGYTAEEMIGRSVSILIPPERAEKEYQIFERVVEGERFEQYRTQRVRKDGRLVDVSMAFTPIRDEFDRVIGVVKVASNITEYKRLQKSELDQLFLASVVSSAEEAIIGKDLNGNVTSWNQAAEKLFGYTAEEMIGKPVSILIPPEHAEHERQILERIRRGERID